MAGASAIGLHQRERLHGAAIREAVQQNFRAGRVRRAAGLDRAQGGFETLLQCCVGAEDHVDGFGADEQDPGRWVQALVAGDVFRDVCWLGGHPGAENDDFGRTSILDKALLWWVV